MGENHQRGARQAQVHQLLSTSNCAWPSIRDTAERRKGRAGLQAPAATDTTPEGGKSILTARTVTSGVRPARSGCRSGNASKRSVKTSTAGQTQVPHGFAKERRLPLSRFNHRQRPAADGRFSRESPAILRRTRDRSIGRARFLTDLAAASGSMKQTIQRAVIRRVQPERRQVDGPIPACEQLEIRSRSGRFPRSQPDASVSRPGAQTTRGIHLSSSRPTYEERTATAAGVIPGIRSA